MNQKEDKIRVNARVPKQLYDWVCSEYDNTSLAINDGLELLKKSKSIDPTENDDKVRHDGIPDHTIKENEIIVSLKERIEDLRAQIVFMSAQLETKDEQLTSLNEITQKQAVHIQSLIQENSKLNTKLLPEVTEKKSWWRFW